MGKVVAEATVSLDGYVAGPNESGFEHLFARFAGRDFEFPSVNPDFKVRLTEPDYRYMRTVVGGIGVLVIGRRMFDLNDGWGGRHPFDKPITDPPRWAGLARRGVSRHPPALPGPSLWGRGPADIS